MLGPRPRSSRRRRPRRPRERDDEDDAADRRTDRHRTGRRRPDRRGAAHPSRRRRGLGLAPGPAAGHAHRGSGRVLGRSGRGPCPHRAAVARGDRRAPPPPAGPSRPGRAGRHRPAPDRLHPRAPDPRGPCAHRLALGTARGAGERRLTPPVRGAGPPLPRAGPPGPATGRGRIQRRRPAPVRAPRLRGHRCARPPAGAQHRLGRVRDPGRAPGAAPPAPGPTTRGHPAGRPPPGGPPS